jgi:hypothetical protein
MIENQRSRGIRVFLTNNGTGYLIETCRITWRNVVSCIEDSSLHTRAEWRGRKGK